MVGDSLGQYRIGSLLGKGGMGELYRATDSRLGREVAVKVLPPELAEDPERAARFEREARSLAALNHPNIAAIHGLEEHSGRTVLVMELAEGEDLSTILQRGPLSADRAISIARQIAEGLEEAHERGIVHRDLKPANLKVDAEGQVKILDFGLARALADDPATQEDFENSPTITAAMTQAGVILGTAAYMSPEQARGRTADKRSDIWSFGVVLWEMLGGKKLFEGETISDTMAGVLKTEIDVSALPASTPPDVVRLLRRCLERDPKRRLRDIGEARILLEGPVADAAAPPAVGGSRRGAILAAGLVGLVLGAGLMGILERRGDAPDPARSARIQIPVVEHGVSPQSALSPDGTAVVYESENQLWIREFASHESRAIPGTELALIATWSPDSEWIAYSTAAAIYRSRTDGGERTQVCRVPRDMHGFAGGLDWGDDGRIIFVTGDSGVWEVSAHGGDPRPILEPREDEVDFHSLEILPGGRGLIFNPHGDLAFNTLDVFDGTSRQEILRIEGANLSSVAYTSGFLLYGRQGNQGVWAAPFSMRDLEVTGEPFLVAENGRFVQANPQGDISYGRLRPVRAIPVRLDATGRVLEEIGEAIEGAQRLEVSPDGRDALLVAGRNQGNHVLAIELVTGTPQRLSFGDEPTADPSWSPDGSRIAYTVVPSNRGMAVVVRDRDGRNEQRVPVRGFDPRLLRDGKRLLLSHWDDANEPSLAIVDLTDPGFGVTMFVDTDASESDPRLTAEEEFAAYVTLESGRPEIVVQAFPSGSGKWQVSQEGGRAPFWSRDNRTLYFHSVDGEWLMAVAASWEPLRFGAPQRVFALNGIDSIDAHPDGGFVALRRADNRTPDTIEVWLNWADSAARGD